MNDLGIIDRFMETFSRYIDSGFGLLSGDVAFLTTILIGIDITLAGLFWALGGEDNIIGRLIRKVLYVGVFALILNNFQNLAEIIYRSFSGLGIQAAPGTLAADDLLKPGKIAATGYEAAYPLIDQVGNLVGFPEIFGNALTVFVLLLAWFLVLIAFFILAIQLFITVLEFKLTTLAGFVLVPFALWNKTSFLAERALGNVISSTIKVRNRTLPPPCRRCWALWRCSVSASSAPASLRVLYPEHRSSAPAPPSAQLVLRWARPCSPVARRLPGRAWPLAAV